MTVSPAERDPSGHGRQRVKRFERNIACVTVGVPALSTLAAAVAWASGHPPSTLILALTGVFYVATVLGITVGFHRHFTHRSFEAAPSLRWFLAVAGSMAAQGPLLFWVATHRRHHGQSDTEHDPHSPLKPDGPLFKRFLRSHMTWMFEHQPEDWNRHARDLLRDTLAWRAHILYPAWVALGFLLPVILVTLVTGSAGQALLAFLWVGGVRVFLVHHVTWSVNSVCHLWGSQPHPVGDGSRNNVVVALLTCGEGWHNNHHAFPYSARHGLAFGQIDVSYFVIRLCSAVGLASRIRFPRDRNQGEQT